VWASTTGSGQQSLTIGRFPVEAANEHLAASLVKAPTEAHGQAMKVESNKGKG
jgi:hypothetical protein